jgi:hypothetical protein
MNPQTLAVLAGVVRFIEESEEADKTAAAGAPAPGTTSGASLWALHGRQSIMRMRALVQQRLLKR